MSRNHQKNMPSVLEDVCIKLLTAAENDPALARLVRAILTTEQRTSHEVGSGPSVEVGLAGKKTIWVPQKYHSFATYDARKKRPRCKAAYTGPS
jgi:hypothetical protein